MFAPHKSPRSPSWIPLGLVTAFGTLVSAPAAIASTPPSFAADSDAKVFEGRFETRIADMFDGTQQITHHLVSESEEIEIDIDPASYPHLVFDAKVRAYGTRTGPRDFEVDWLEVTETPPEPLINPTPRTPRRIAVLLVQPGGQGDDMTVDELRARVFTNEDSTERFFVENSYGMESFDGDAFGPYSISAPSGCDYQAIGEAARSAFAAAGNNVDDYDQFMYYMTRISGCGWSGLASVGSPDRTARDTWYNGSAGCVVLAQELAHNYGLMHTHTYVDCSSGVFPGPSGCSENEYGSPYDPMGRGCGHTANYQKSYMGWHQECNIVTTQQNATYNLLPTELPCNGTQTLRLPLGDGNYYYLEYRRPVGTFARWSGVLVYYGPEYTGDRSGPDGFLVNVTNADDWFMHAGESYTDYNNRVTFTVSEENDTHAVIEVNYPSGSGSPSCAGGGAPIDGGNGHIGSLECLPGPPDGDTTPPTVTITAPADGSTFEAPAAFTVTADAMDDVAVTSVSLTMNGMSVGSDTSAPYEWPISDLPEGEYSFQASAMDSSNVTMSAAITVTVTGGTADSGDSGGSADIGDETGDDESGSGGGGGTGDGSGDDGGMDGGLDEGGVSGGVTGGLPPPPGQGFDGDASVGGCGCRQSVPVAPWWSFLLVPLAMGTRRRPKSFR